MTELIVESKHSKLKGNPPNIERERFITTWRPASTFGFPADLELGRTQRLSRKISHFSRKKIFSFKSKPRHVYRYSFSHIGHLFLSFYYSKRSVVPGTRLQPIES